MKTAVVTGATGFIGKAFTRYLLEKGYRVIAVVRDASHIDDEFISLGLESVEADYTEYDRLAAKIGHADIFYHFAWDGVWGKEVGNYTLQMSNVGFACEALMQAVKMGCVKFVFAGTVAELEIREYLDKNVCRPRIACVYAMAKLTAEMMCKTLASQNGISFNAGLFANTIGPGDYSRRSTNTILKKFLNREAPQFVKGEGLNDWLYIKDAVRLIEAMGENGVDMKTYYIGHTELRSLRKTIERARDIVAPGLKLDFGTIPDEFLTDYSYISTDELYRDTGCRASYSFTEAIKETAEWVMTMDQITEKTNTQNRAGGGNNYLNYIFLPSSESKVFCRKAA